MASEKYCGHCDEKSVRFDSFFFLCDLDSTIWEHGLIFASQKNRKLGHEPELCEP